MEWFSLCQVEKAGGAAYFLLSNSRDIRLEPKEEHMEDRHRGEL